MHFPIIDDQLPGVVVDFVECEFLPSLKMCETHFLVGMEFPDRFHHGHRRKISLFAHFRDEPLDDFPRCHALGFGGEIGDDAVVENGGSDGFEIFQ